MREVSPTALRAMLAQETAEVFLPCLIISHPDLPEAIRLVQNNEVLHRAEGDYLPYLFKIDLPEQSDDETPMLTLTVDNIDLSVNEKIRMLTGQPDVTLIVVLASSPDTVEAGPFPMKLSTVTVTAQSLTSSLGQEQDIFSQQVPGRLYLPTNSPGLFL